MPFKALQQRCLLAANIGAGTAVQIKLVVIAGAAGILPEKAGLISFINSGLKACRLGNELAADVDIASRAPHGDAGDQAAFDQFMGIVAHDLPVFAGAGLALIGIDHQIDGATIAFLGHEGPFETGWKTGPTAASET